MDICGVFRELPPQLQYFTLQSDMLDLPLPDKVCVVLRSENHLQTDVTRLGQDQHQDLLPAVLERRPEAESEQQ
ncbi:unnamed protein product [Closterium sp. Naga37s-1]|nr:unnamed protein product [Closterium sp. Naga37s-1]